MAQSTRTIGVFLGITVFIGAMIEGAAAAPRRPARRQRCCPASAKHIDDGSGTLFDGKSLAGWRVADKFDFSQHGKVAVREGRIEMQAGGPETGIVRTDKPPRLNYELSLEAMRISGNDFFCGLTFPVKNEHCTLIVGGWGGTLVGLSNVDGIAANENETTTFADFKNKQWYRIRLRVTASNIDIWIDDRRMIQLETTDRKFNIWWEQEPMRPLGIATWYTGAALRNIKLRRLTVEELKTGPTAGGEAAN
ncbi:MAG: DUF1080 domain-containing protein [Pirellulales bacterium]